MELLDRLILRMITPVKVFFLIARRLGGACGGMAFIIILQASGVPQCLISFSILFCTVLRNHVLLS